MNCVNTGIIVLDDNGVIYQTNNEALRLLGLAVFTNVRQLARIDENLKTVIQNIQPGDKHQISFTNERGNVHLSIRVSEMTLQDKHVRILAINDINSELDDKEIDFIATSNGPKRYIQVTETMSDSETRKRELAPLMAVQDNYEKSSLRWISRWIPTSTGLRS